MSRKIGFTKATSLVAGNMLGSGVLLAPAILAPYGNWALWGWIITSIGALALAIVFAKLSQWIPKNGGPYSYAYEVFGPFIGFQMAWGYWISTWCGSASLVIGTIQYLSLFTPQISTTFSILIGLSLIAFFTYINMRGIGVSTSMETVIVLFKTIPLILISIIGIFFIDHVPDFTTLPSLPDGVSIGMMAPTLLWAFIGVESATIPVAEIENPTKNIVRATVCGVLITAIIYIASCVVITAVLTPTELAASKAPFVEAARKLFGPIAGWIMAITGIIGVAGSLNGWTLIQGYVPQAAAKEKLFPEFFARSNRHNAPAGVWVGSLCMSALFLATYQESVNAQINILIDLSVFAMLIPYFYAVIAALIIFWKEKKYVSEKRLLLVSTALFVAIAYSASAIIFSGKDLIFQGFIMFLLSVPCYLLVYPRTQKSSS